MNTHFKAIPSVRPLSTRRFTRGNLKRLCRHANRPLDFQLLVLRAADKVSAYLLKRLDIARSQGDADFLVVSQALISRLFHGGSGHIEYDVQRLGDLRVFAGLVAVTSAVLHVRVGLQ